MPLAGNPPPALPAGGLNGEDYPNFTRGPLKAGDTVHVTSFVHYDIGPDGRFAAIRVGRYGD